MAAKDDFKDMVFYAPKIVQPLQALSVLEALDRKDRLIAHQTELIDRQTAELIRLREIRTALEAVELYSTSADRKHLFLSFEDRSRVDQLMELFA